MNERKKKGAMLPKKVKPVLMLILMSSMLLLLFVQGLEPIIQWEKIIEEATISTQFPSVPLIKVSDGYVTVGTVSGASDTDCLLVKTDFSGNVTWTKQLVITPTSEFPSDVIQVEDGYMITGTSSAPMIYGQDFFLAKTDLSGNLAWNYTYGNPPGSIEIAKCMMRDNSTVYGGILIVGTVQSSHYYSPHIWLVKTDLSGKMDWNMTITGGSGVMSMYTTDDASSVIKGSDGDYIIAGCTSAFGNFDLMLIKTAYYGPYIRWIKNFTTSAREYPKDMILASDGILITGYSDATGSDDYWVFKSDLIGNRIWNYTFGGTTNERASSIIQSSDAYLIVGTTEAGSNDVWLIKTDKEGGEQWNKIIGDATASEQAYSIIQSNEGFLIAGSSSVSGTNKIFLANITEPSQLLVSISTLKTSAPIGETITLIANPSGGILPYSYQWYEGSAMLTGETSTQLSVKKDTETTTVFSCRVIDLSGQTTTSNPITLSFIPINVSPSQLSDNMALWIGAPVGVTSIVLALAAATLWRKKRAGAQSEALPVLRSEKISPSTINVLFLAANPVGTTLLDLNTELNAIEDVIDSCKFRDRFNIEQRFELKPGEIAKMLLKYDPHIVHFSGHGSEAGEIILQDENGEVRPMDASAIANLFSVLKGNIRCVVLNACYSKHQAKLISKYIDCVIGMSKAIGDEAAIQFAEGFYRGLGFGKDLETAFKLGCAEIDLEGLDEEDTPKIIWKDNIPKKIALT